MVKYINTYLRRRSTGLHLFADHPFDLVGKAIADAVYGLQLAAAS
jgi:hypothetical protein